MHCLEKDKAVHAAKRRISELHVFLHARHAPKIYAILKQISFRLLNVIFSLRCYTAIQMTLANIGNDDD